ncbi:MAG: acetyl-CoA carboxylase biotin carboxylase subunit [Enorma sp.]|uniref:acetyl-CoA carboxylase biotin carboxylase subunit n=1 Tax=Enorma sp. TaxID=1920692 RepID=UPI0025838CEA|nr:acetyl-CoA carboxylase biotin carboxylase subunit [Enorma sp.]MCI7775873.1 acetyl-CoA carboxylase biotin carboxylase subunit [Enorma sp.]
MFKKILIANRGEIAVRVIRACKEMGVQTVAVYSTADANALHVQLADEAYCIGGPRPQDSYLNEDAILTVAVASGATAIHPGYGFLSENAGFARRCRECGVVFVGPSPEVIERMGDKDAARRCAKEAGVPIVPGCDLLKSAEEAEREAERIGCPVLIKARAGGGGRGIRKVECAQDAGKAFTEAHAEAEAAFGDGECYMEKFVAPAHHVEVQVLADAHGNVVTLGERECSVQRRNQKLLEESPAPCLEGRDDIRERMYEAARNLARAVGYEGAGTIEYLYADDGNFYFMEMNTRLQVEHPVTEFVTDIDLVKWQLRVAAGVEFPYAQDEIMPAKRSHAIECRINAEGPAPDYRPSCGTIHSMHVPNGPWVRFDSSLYPGAVVPPYYDSMLGKLIVRAGTREEAIRKMRSALTELIIDGVDANTELQLDILSNSEFLSGIYHTNLMEHLYED